ncbi:MAG: hypothetical protein QOI52_876 [Chloroflexota bacterium]|jgi:hypothetical protein|nr:hypothetical protein [Chloroflexota bacterium]
MGLLEGFLGLAVVVLLALGVALIRRRRTAPPPYVLEDVLGSAHERIDEIELARVRSMLQRR